MIAFTLQILISFRDHLVIDITKETPDSIPTAAVGIFKGIGFIIIGNLYDNVRMPKRLTFYLLSALALLTALCAVVPAEVARNEIVGDETDQEWNQLIVQMSSIRMFESGVQMACMIILFNWFPLSISFLVVSLWSASYQIVPFF